MNMTILLTRNGYETLTNKLSKLLKNDLVDVVKMIEETRPIGCSDEFPPEYMQALDLQNRVEKKILDIRKILNDCEIFNPKLIKYNKDHKIKIGFGTIVKLLNCNNSKEITYTLVSIYESDINNGYMSISAPFATEMMGLSVGDTFEFNDVEYEILDVTYVN
jgi:transcription elongation GreA/GreB family factor